MPPYPVQSPVVYHGSFARFDVFDPRLLGHNTNARSATMGFFFAAHPAVAVSYASTDAVRTQAAEEVRERVAGALLGLTGARNFFDMERRYVLREYDHQPFFTEFERLFNEHRQADDVLADLQFAYVDAPRLGEDGSLYAAHLTLERPLEHDFGGLPMRERSFADLLTEAHAGGHDGAVFYNVEDGATTAGSFATDIYVVFDAFQVSVHSRLEGEAAADFLRGFDQREVAGEAVPTPKPAPLSVTQYPPLPGTSLTPRGEGGPALGYQEHPRGARR